MNAPPQWTDAIADGTLCNYYYIFFIVFSVLAALSLLGGLWMFATTKMPIGVLSGLIFNVLITSGISATSALFFYLICERALKPKVRNTTSQVVSSYEMM